MNNILVFLAWLSPILWQIVPLLVLIVLLLWLWRCGKKSLVKKILYAMVVEAEKFLGSNTGKEKMAYVLQQYYKLPWIIRIVFPQSTVIGYIEEGVQLLKARLQEQDVNLLGYAEEKASAKIIKTETLQQ